MPIRTLWRRWRRRWARSQAEAASRAWARARTRLLFGVLAALVGVLCNVFTENYCEKSDFFEGFPGHALWHVLSSWGLLNCLVLAAMTRLDDSAYPHLHILPDVPSDPAERTWFEQLQVAYFAILPGFEFDPDDTAHTGDEALARPPAHADRADSKWRRPRQVIALRSLAQPELRQRVQRSLVWLDRSVSTEDEKRSLVALLRQKATELEESVGTGAEAGAAGIASSGKAGRALVYPRPNGMASPESESVNQNRSQSIQVSTSV